MKCFKKSKNTRFYLRIHRTKWKVESGEF